MISIQPREVRPSHACGKGITYPRCGTTLQGRVGRGRVCKNSEFLRIKGEGEGLHLVQGRRCRRHIGLEQQSCSARLQLLLGNPVEHYIRSFPLLVRYHTWLIWIYRKCESVVGRVQKGFRHVFWTLEVTYLEMRKQRAGNQWSNLGKSQKKWEISQK